MLKNLEINRKIENFVYCSGKTGSMSLNNSLVNSFHTHSLLFFIRTQLKDFSFPKIDDKINNDIFDVIDLNIKKYNTKTVYFYDVYRKPIERKISAFFQFINVTLSKKPELEKIIRKIKNKPFLYTFNVNNLNKNNFFQVLENNISFMIEIFWWTFMIETDNYYSFEEYKNINNFKIQKKEFYYQDNGKYKYVILRFEGINNWSKILSYIHNKNIIINKSNITEEKGRFYDKVYPIFKKKFFIPKVLFMILFFKNHRMHELHLECNHYKIMQKFHSEDEIKNYIKSWISLTNSKI